MPKNIFSALGVYLHPMHPPWLRLCRNITGRGVLMLIDISPWRA